ncbi:hypothetical protein [Tropicimonas isoalkanivorans]|uniref:Uncharacterized protein n=1 Tax=Tropicimonas isoalkanivorans TaxID=441112 RepID=A0A1I1G353_9RHOB|nr:hypothetical protein [Tropicimonas isoalkanivorans]SFC06157.1 hypothetical protein SAMN04488094_102404 [Tropicimonas isoalkanivorans]
MSIAGSGHSSTGSSARGVVAAMMALVMALLVLTMMLEDRTDDLSQVEGLGSFVAGQIATQAFAGAICGWLLATFFGRSGGVGWVLSVLGGLLVTLLAGALAGVLQSLPEILSEGLALTEALKVAVGLLVVIFASAGRPMVAVGWLALILLTHVLAARQRRG